MASQCWCRAMHVEAMNWSGMGVREYASGLRLSPYALRKWRDRFENAEVEIDWRAHLHPSACPQTSTGASSAAKDCSPENDLTAARDAEPRHDGRSNRRSFTNEEKLAVVLESEQPGMCGGGLPPPSHCHEHGVPLARPVRLYGQEGREAGNGYAAGRRHRRIVHPRGAERYVAAPRRNDAVQLSDGRHVFAHGGSDPDAVRQHVLDREAAQ